MFHGNPGSAARLRTLRLRKMRSRRVLLSTIVRASRSTSATALGAQDRRKTTTSSCGLTRPQTWRGRPRRALAPSRGSSTAVLPRKKRKQRGKPRRRITAAGARAADVLRAGKSHGGRDVRMESLLSSRAPSEHECGAQLFRRADRFLRARCSRAIVSSRLPTNEREGKEAVRRGRESGLGWFGTGCSLHATARSHFPACRAAVRLSRVRRKRWASGLRHSLQLVNRSCPVSCKCLRGRLSRPHRDAWFASIPTFLVAKLVDYYNSLLHTEQLSIIFDTGLALQVICHTVTTPWVILLLP